MGTKTSPEAREALESFDRAARQILVQLGEKRYSRSAVADILGVNKEAYCFARKGHITVDRVLRWVKTWNESGRPKLELQMDGKGVRVVPVEGVKP